MKISLDVVTTTKAEYDIEFPYYLKRSNNLNFLKYLGIKKAISIDLYDFGFGIEYSESIPLERYIGELVESNETEFNKALNVVKLKLEGMLDEMHKADEQQQGD